MAKDLKDEAVLIIETVTDWSYKEEPTEENLDKLIDVVSELLDDIIKRNDG